MHGSADLRPHLPACKPGDILYIRNFGECVKVALYRHLAGGFILHLTIPAIYVWFRWVVSEVSDACGTWLWPSKEPLSPLTRHSTHSYQSCQVETGELRPYHHCNVVILEETGQQGQSKPVGTAVCSRHDAERVARRGSRSRRKPQTWQSRIVGVGRT
jgi:hypothetical protein